MTADRVTYANLFSESWNNVYQLINNRDNVSDPNSGTGQHRTFVYDSEPDVKSSGFDGYPFVIVYPSVFEQEKIDRSSVDGKSKQVYWIVEIEIVSSDRGHNDAISKGRTSVDSISNEVIQTLNDATNRKTLRSNGLYFVNPDGGSQNQEPLAKEKVFRRSIMLSFQNKLQVSQ